MLNRILKLMLICSVGLLFITQTGCTDKYKPAGTEFSSDDESSCLFCHLDAELLKDVADPIETGGESSGEG